MDDEVRTAVLLYPGLPPATAWERHPQQLRRVVEAFRSERASVVSVLGVEAARRVWGGPRGHGASEADPSL